MKLLVPTDFSAASANALAYAAGLATMLRAELILLHVVIQASSDRQSPHEAEIAMRVLEDRTDREFGMLEEKAFGNTRPTVPIKHQLCEGHTIHESINEFAQQVKPDLIVMGSKGASGLEKVLLGSNAASVISHSRIPVLTVPKRARFRSVQNIVYASDLHSITHELGLLVDFARLFKARIHVLHVNTDDENVNADKLLNTLRDKFQYPDISVHLPKEPDLEEAIENCIADTDADLLIMFTHETGFLERLFGTSVTREMAFHTGTPLLSFHKKRK